MSSGVVIIHKLGWGWKVFLQDGTFACKSKCPSEQGKNHSPFYDLSLDFIYHCFCQVLLVTHINSDSVGEFTQGHKYQLAGIFGDSLGGWLPHCDHSKGPYLWQPPVYAYPGTGQPQSALHIALPCRIHFWKCTANNNNKWRCNLLILKMMKPKQRKIKSLS